MQLCNEKKLVTVGFESRLHKCFARKKINVGILIKVPRNYRYQNCQRSMADILFEPIREYC